MHGIYGNSVFLQQQVLKESCLIVKMRHFGLMEECDDGWTLLFFLLTSKWFNFFSLVLFCSWLTYFNSCMSLSWLLSEQWNCRLCSFRHTLRLASCMWFRLFSTQIFPITFLSYFMFSEYSHFSFIMKKLRLYVAKYFQYLMLVNICWILKR